MQKLHGKVVWFTGLSGAGKSTLCSALAKELELLQCPVQILDSDVVRSKIGGDLGFSIKDRHESIARLTYLAALLAEHGVTVLVAAITPLREMQEMLRSALPGVLLVHVDASLEVCESRDRKGLYRRARAGALPDFTGIDSPYEAPLLPDIVCHTGSEGVEESMQKVLLRLLPSASPSESGAASSRRLTLAVDMDGVIANYDGWKGENHLGSPRADVVEVMRTLQSEGWKLVVHTTRSESTVGAYLMEHCIPFHEINRNSDYITASPKPVATVYWDDRALRYSGSGEKDITLIRRLLTWNGRR